ncbi:hypothetical protein HELRODRAFT_88502, partial [Helobdella robusta]|uniref:P4-ATPase flippase complex beta subunit TMEM30A n=1 Tax=Helobdella robusta TaxID=6412 RepID=T1G734_HELRO
SDSKFKQQKLPAWQPILTAESVLPLLFAVGVSFIPIGIAFLIVTNAVKEKVIDYTYCVSVDNANATCANIISDNITTVCKCQVQFNLESDYPAPVFLYYKLKNFYQNHRRYVKSRDDDQLLGKDKTGMSISECEPFYKDSNTGLYYAPCGAIANSLFNDTFSLSYQLNDPNITNSDMNIAVNLIKRNIAWLTDRNSKFHNPQDFFDDSITVFKKSIQPLNWRKNVYQLDTEDPTNNGYNNEELMVWMRVAAFHNFRKLHRHINHTGLFKNGLKSGNYSFIIEYNYPVTKFDGRKKLILTTTSFLGGKNSFLGIAYLVVGCLSIVIGVIFVIIHFRVGKK